MYPVEGQTCYYEVFSDYDSKLGIGSCIMGMLDGIVQKRVCSQFAYRETACRMLACYAVLDVFTHGVHNPVELWKVHKNVMTTGRFKCLYVRTMVETYEPSDLGCFVCEHNPADEKDAFPSFNKLLKIIRQMHKNGDFPIPVDVPRDEKMRHQKPKLKTVYRTRDICADRPPPPQKKSKLEPWRK